VRVSILLSTTGSSDVRLSLVGMKSSFGGIGYDTIFELDAVNLCVTLKISHAHFYHVIFTTIVWSTGQLRLHWSFVTGNFVVFNSNLTIVQNFTLTCT